ncbi:MAG: hypothetical protein IJV39_06580 [Ruminococcus sp.]|nr:hypothetical protein [Ruminococcus sp.]
MIKTSNTIAKIFAAILSLFTVMTISLASTYGINGKVFSLRGDAPAEKYFWVYSIIILGGISIALGLLLIFRFIEKISDKKLKIFAAVLIGLFGLGCFTVIYLFPTIPMTDSFYVHDTAISLAKGDISQIDGSTNYFRKYSNNNMMVYMLALIYKAANSLGISDLLTVGRVVNVLALFSTELLFYFGIKKLTGKRTTAVKYLVISIIYPTMMFMASWVYTATFSMPLIGGLVYLSACILNTDSKLKIGIYSSICGFIIAVGYFL